MTKYHRWNDLNNRIYFPTVLEAGGLRSEDQCDWVLFGALSSWITEGRFLSVSSSFLICLLKTISPATGTWWGRALTYEWGNPCQPVAMYNFSTVVNKGYPPCSYIDILVHDSEVEEYFIKITFLQVTFYTVLSLSDAIPKSMEFGKAVFK